MDCPFALIAQHRCAIGRRYVALWVIEVAEGIPFIELTDWDESRLYALKGEIVRRGVAAITGLTMPVFEKRRFQRGATSEETFDSVFPADAQEYRQRFLKQFA